MREYEKCYHIDFEGIKACLDEEVDRLRNELRKSQEDSDNLVQKMQMFLKQNHQIVQDFLKTSHKAVYNLAKPSTRRGGNLVTNDSNAMTERSEISETGTGEEVGWEPALSWVPAFGVEQANNVEWPKLPELKKLNLANSMKLKSIDVGTTSNLYEINLNFSNGVSSNILRTPYAGESHEVNTNLRNFPIDMKKRIADVYIN